MSRRGEDGPAPADLKRLGSYESVLKLFRKYDVSRTNRLSWKELHQMMLDLNKATTGYNWTDANTDMLLATLDKNRDHNVDIQELTAYIFPRGDAMGGTVGASEYEMVLEHFRRHDTNRNGTLDKPEFTKLMTQLKSGWTAADTERVFRGVDSDNSGEVESDELVAWLFGVPCERTRAADRMRKAAARGEAPPASAGPLVIIEFVCGEGGASVDVDNIKARWERKLNGQVAVKKTVSGLLGQVGSRGSSITKVSARNGAIVFWDAATMMAYRDNPFQDARTTQEWSNEMLARHIPRLLGGT